MEQEVDIVHNDDDSKTAITTEFGHFIESCVTYPSGTNQKQDGRLAPAYFSHEYKYFDQHLPIVKNETTV